MLHIANDFKWVQTVLFNYKFLACTDRQG